MQQVETNKAKFCAPPASWHENVTCVWNGSQLILQADKDFDSNGLALVDEFSDAISACIKDGFDGDIEVLSVTAL